MKGLEIIKNGGEPLRIGAYDGLILVMFNHIDRSDIPNLIEPLSRSNLTKKEQLLSKYSDQSIDFERILYICR